MAYEQYGSWIPSSVITSSTTVVRKGQAPYSKTTNITYNSKGSATEVKDFVNAAKNTTTTTTYKNPVGLPDEMTITATGAKTQTSTMTYTPNYRFLATSTNSLGQTTTSTFNPLWGKLQSVTGIDGLTTSYDYDELGREIAVTPPQGYAVETHYRWGGTGLYNVVVRHPRRL
jgi:YD repeat-containing protein